MARRSDHSREELRELAIRCGTELVEKEGIAGFSARKVTAAMGYTVGTLYHIFGSLDEFVLHVNAGTLDEWYEAIKDIPPQSGQPVHALAKAYVRFVEQHYGRWNLLFGYALAQDAGIPQWYREKIERLFSLAEAVLAPRMNGGEQEVKRAARVLWSSVHGICVLSMSGKLEVAEAESAEILVTTLVDYLLKGMEN